MSVTCPTCSRTLLVPLGATLVALCPDPMEAGSLARQWQYANAGMGGLIILNAEAFVGLSNAELFDLVVRIRRLPNAQDGMKVLGDGLAVVRAPCSSP